MSLDIRSCFIPTIIYDVNFVPVMAFSCVFVMLYKITILVIFGSTFSVNSFILVVSLREVG